MLSSSDGSPILMKVAADADDADDSKEELSVRGYPPDTLARCPDRPRTPVTGFLPSARLAALAAVRSGAWGAVLHTLLANATTAPPNNKSPHRGIRMRQSDIRCHTTKTRLCGDVRRWHSLGLQHSARGHHRLLLRCRRRSGTGRIDWDYLIRRRDPPLLPSVMTSVLIRQIR